MLSCAKSDLKINYWLFLPSFHNHASRIEIVGTIINTDVIIQIQTTRCKSGRAVEVVILNHNEACAMQG